MNCEFVKHEQTCVCRFCGRQVKSPDCAKTYAPCRNDDYHLGDELEKALTALGITQERWTGVKAALGLYPNCNCDKRKQWLNKASVLLQVKARALKNALENYYASPR